MRWGIDMRQLFTFIYFTLTGAVLTGCASSVSEATQSNAWTAYQEFEQDLIQVPDRVSYEHHLFDGWIAMFENADSDEDLAELESYASYPHWFMEITSHYEKASGDGRCLLVNGVAFDRSPGTLAVRYVNQAGRLRASEIHYQFWENEREAPLEARCPEEYALELPAEP